MTVALTAPILAAAITENLLPAAAAVEVHVDGLAEVMEIVG